MALNTFVVGPHTIGACSVRDKMLLAVRCRPMISVNLGQVSGNMARHPDRMGGACTATASLPQRRLDCDFVVTRADHVPLLSAL